MPEGRVQRVSSQAPPYASCRSHSHLLVLQQPWGMPPNTWRCYAICHNSWHRPYTYVAQHHMGAGGVRSTRHGV